MGILNDDAVALFMLLNTDNIDVLGITTVAGNTWVEEGTAYTLRQLELIGRTDIPVHMGIGEPLMGDRSAQMEAEETIFGASEYIGAFARPRPCSYMKLGEVPSIGYPQKTKVVSTDAVDFIVDTVKKNPGEVTLVVLGPGMNVALAIKKNPEIIPMVKQVYYMGGAIDIPGNTTPAAEFNWWYDPYSIKMVLNAPFARQVIVPNDIAESVYYTKKEYDRIVKAPETPITKMYKDIHGPRFAKTPDKKSFVWDAIVSAILIDPSIATDVQERYIDIDVNYGPNFGRSIGYHESRNRDLTKPENFPPNSQKVEILFDIDQKAFWDLYVEKMTRQK